MKTSVLWSFEARVDFEEILLARSELSPKSARQLREALLDAIDRLRDFPDMGRELPVRGPRGSHRRLVSGTHLIDYRHVDDTVIVLAIRDGRTAEPGS